MVSSEMAGGLVVAETIPTTVSGVPSKQLYLVTFYSALSGFLFGYDTGIISGALLLLKRHFGLNSVWQEVVVSVTILGAWTFSLLATVLTERFGRKPCILFCSVLFTCGSALMAAAHQVWVVVLGRLVVGAAVGLSSAAVPLYIAEVSTPAMRGKLVTINNCLITGGQFIASVTAGAFSRHPHGWRYMLGLAAIPSLIQNIGFLFAPESPRWLVKHGQLEKAYRALAKLRADNAKLDAEFDAIKAHCQNHNTEEDSPQPTTAGASQTSIPFNNGQSNFFQVIRKDPAIRRALVVGCMLQLIQQLAGINTIMYYSASIIEMAGIHDPSHAIWLSSLTSLTNFLFTFVGFYLVERIGRRPLTLGSLLGVCMALFLLAGSFYMVNQQTPNVSYKDSSSGICSQFSSCSQCVATPSCGFCYQPSSDLTQLNGTCLLSLQPDHQTSANGSCAAPLNSSYVWAYNWCPSQFAWLIVVGLIFYLMSFASGLGSMPWTINAELYPMRVRSWAFSFSTSLNWLANLIVSLTFLSLMEGIGETYTFLVYLVISWLGLCFFFVYLPETRGRTLEDIEKLFRKSSDRNPVFRPSIDYGTKKTSTTLDELSVSISSSGSGIIPISK